MPHKYLCLALVLALLLGASGTALAVDGETVVTGKCTACHSIDRVKTKQLSAGDWATLVDREIQRGAQLNADERSAAILYLSTNYGVPAAASPAPDPPATTTVTPTTQAYTGIEMWQIVLMGGSLLGGGVWLRRKR